MPRACSLCTHPDRLMIETALRGGIPLRTIAARWSVSKTALLRHRDKHGRPPPAMPQAAEPSGALDQASIAVPQIAEGPAPPAVVDADAQAVAAYEQAVAAYEAMRQVAATRRHGVDAGMLVVKWEQVKHAYQQCLACGVDPARR